MPYKECSVLFRESLLRINRKNGVVRGKVESEKVDNAFNIGRFFGWWLSKDREYGLACYEIGFCCKAFYLSGPQMSWMIRRQKIEYPSAICKVAIRLRLCRY